MAKRPCMQDTFARATHSAGRPSAPTIVVYNVYQWYMRHGLVITTRDCARGDSMRNFIRELCPGVLYTYGEPMFLLTDRL